MARFLQEEWAITVSFAEPFTAEPFTAKPFTAKPFTTKPVTTELVTVLSILTRS